MSKEAGGVVSLSHARLMIFNREDMETFALLMLSVDRT